MNAYMCEHTAVHTDTHKYAHTYLHRLSVYPPKEENRHIVYHRKPPHSNTEDMGKERAAVLSSSGSTVTSRKTLPAKNLKAVKAH